MEPHVIDMGEVFEGWSGQTIKVKPWMSYAAATAIETAAIPQEAAAQDGDGEDAPTPLGSAVMARSWAWIRHQVLEWSLRDYEGELIEHSFAGITGDAVPADLIDQAVVAIEEYYEALRPPAFRRTGTGG